MVCKHCGKELSSPSAFCPFCGASLQDQETQSSSYQSSQTSSASNSNAQYTYRPGPQQEKVPYNELCVVGMIVSCVSVIWNVFGILSIVGLVLSIIGLRQCKARGQRGKELAITGIAVGAVAVVLGILVTIWRVQFVHGFMDSFWPFVHGVFHEFEPFHYF